MAVTPDDRTAYVTDTAPYPVSDTVTPIRIATNTVLKPIKVGTESVAIAITP